MVFLTVLCSGGLCGEPEHGMRWPDVWGGKSNPQDHYMGSCTGSLFATAPEFEPNDKSVVGVLAPEPFSLWLCDKHGWKGTLEAELPPGDRPTMVTSTVLQSEKGLTIAWASPDLLLGVRLGKSGAADARRRGKARLPPTRLVPAYSTRSKVAAVFAWKRILELSDSICAAHCSTSAVFAVALGISCGKAIADADEACSNAENSISSVEDAVARAQERLRTVGSLVAGNREDAASHGEGAGRARLAMKLGDIVEINTGDYWNVPARVPEHLPTAAGTLVSSLGLSLLDPERAWKTLETLLSAQLEDGAIPLQLFSPTSLPEEAHFPMLAWASYDVFLHTGKLQQLSWAAPRVARWLNWLEANRSRDGGLTFFWQHAGETPAPWAPRFDSVRYFGPWELQPKQILSVDLTAMAAHEHLYLAAIYTLLGDNQRAAASAQRACEITQALSSEAWDEQLSFFFDRYEMATGRLFKTPHRMLVNPSMIGVQGLAPLLLPGLPQKQVRELLRHVNETFAGHRPVPSAPMWKRTPASVSTNLWVAKALDQQGEKAAARAVLKGSLAMVKGEYEASGGIFEFYDARPHRHAIPAAEMPISTRLGRQVKGAIRDHGPTAAVALRMMYELGSPPLFEDLDAAEMEMLGFEKDTEPAGHSRRHVHGPCHKVLSLMQAECLQWITQSVSGTCSAI